MNEVLPDLLRDSGLPARIVAAPVLFGFGLLQGNPLHLTLPQAMLLRGCLLLGAGIMANVPSPDAGSS
jgi:hypothetical protein